jgi:hypothetical protein
MGSIGKVRSILTVALRGASLLASVFIGLLIGSALLDGNRAGWCGLFNRFGSVGLDCGPLPDAQPQVVLLLTVATIAIVVGSTFAVRAWRQRQFSRIRRGRAVAGPNFPAVMTFVRVYTVCWWLMFLLLLGQPARLILGQVPEIGSPGELGPWGVNLVWFALPAAIGARLHIQLARPIELPEEQLDDIDDVLAKGGEWCTLEGQVGAAESRAPALDLPCAVWQFSMQTVSVRSWDETLYDGREHFLPDDRKEKDGTVVTFTAEPRDFGPGWSRYRVSETTAGPPVKKASTRMFNVMVNGRSVTVDPTDIDLQAPELWHGDPNDPNMGKLKAFFKDFKTEGDNTQARLVGLRGGERVTITGVLLPDGDRIRLCSPSQAAALGVRRPAKGNRAAIRVAS